MVAIKKWALQGCVCEANTNWFKGLCFAVQKLTNIDPRRRRLTPGHLPSAERRLWIHLTARQWLDRSFLSQLTRKFHSASAKRTCMSRTNGHLGFIEPQLPTLVDQPPHGSDWIHEIKHHGYRTLLVVEDGLVRAYTRNGFNWSERYPGIVRAAAKLNCRSAIIDGEVIVQDENGVSDFDALKTAIRWQPERLIFYAFDLLHLNGKDLREETLSFRRTKLKGLIRTPSRLQFSEEFTGSGADLFRACIEHGLEGLVSKLSSSRYRSGRTKTWLKTKCFTESAFVIIGTDRDRKTGAVRALLARTDDQGLIYAGPAFIALAGSERQDFRTRLEGSKVDRCPIPKLRISDARWVDPKLVVRVRHLAGTKYLRHATVRGFADRA
jgi:bifunctional non-homologous end joining protein LigD